MNLEEWLWQCPAEAVKEFARAMPNAHNASKPRAIKYILSDPASTEVAEQSKTTEEEVFKWIESHPARDRRLR